MEKFFRHYRAERISVSPMHESYMRQFFMQEHFADLKQAYIAGLLKALGKYTPGGGAKKVTNGKQL